MTMFLLFKLSITKLWQLPILSTPPLFCLKKPTNNLQIAASQNESRTAPENYFFNDAQPRVWAEQQPLLEALPVLARNHAVCSTVICRPVTIHAWTDEFLHRVAAPFYLIDSY